MFWIKLIGETLESERKAIGFYLVNTAALVLIAGPWIMRRRGMRGDLAQGTLVVTGVSPRPDETGRQFVTITGESNSASMVFTCVRLCCR